MNYYNEIKEKLIKSEIYDRAKDYSKDRHKVSVYFETGKLLSEAGKEYGKNIIKQYSEKLMLEVGKNNRYGHPNKEVLNVLDNSKIYRTDQDGSIMFKIKNNKLKIETCSP